MLHMSVRPTALPTLSTRLVVFFACILCDSFPKICSVFPVSELLSSSISFELFNSSPAGSYCVFKSSTSTTHVQVSWASSRFASSSPLKECCTGFLMFIVDMIWPARHVVSIAFNIERWYAGFGGKTNTRYHIVIIPVDVRCTRDNALPSRLTRSVIYHRVVFVCLSSHIGHATILRRTSALWR